MKNKPFKYSEWIKHAYDFEEGVSPVEYVGNEVLVMAHPAHPKVSLNLEDDVVAQVYALPKSLQLYFFGLVWVGFCNLEDDAEWSAVKKILLSLFDYAKSNPKLHKKEMVWDDHALSERACVLIYLKQALRRKHVLSDIDYHLKILIGNLDVILASKKWEGNNHRVFHLCAKWCLQKYYVSDEASANFYLEKIEDFFFTLIDIETGLSVEQSVSYYNFDVILLKMVSSFLDSNGDGFSDFRLDFKVIEKKKNMHIKALAFPDGQLPASGDTPLGISVSSPSFTNSERYQLWKGLERMGHFRGCSENEKFHYHILNHNAEAAHGHHSPLHLDLWVEGIGMVLVDSGGPYKYGDKLRYEWFRSPKAHNTINFIHAENLLKQYSVSVSHINDELKGIVQCGDDFFYRSISVNDDFFHVVDKVAITSEWSLSWHFSSFVDVIKVASGEFDIICKDMVLKLSISSDSNLDINLCDGFLTYRGGEKVVAPYIFIKGTGSTVINTTFNFGVGFGI